MCTYRMTKPQKQVVSAIVTTAVIMTNPMVIPTHTKGIIKRKLHTYILQSAPLIGGTQRSVMEGEAANFFNESR